MKSPWPFSWFTRKPAREPVRPLCEVRASYVGGHVDALDLDSIAAGLCLDIAALLHKRGAYRVSIVLRGGERWTCPCCPTCGAELRARAFVLDPDCADPYHIDV